MDPRSEANLQHVHPALCGIMRAAAEVVRFVVIEGLRTPAQEALNCAHGTSHTLHSRHLPNAEGLACAVDVAPVDEDGHVFIPPNGVEAPFYTVIADAVKAAAAKVDVPIQWGGDPVGAWIPGVASHFRDWGHFQLPWKEYP